MDFMPPRSGHSHLVRLVIGESGRVKVRSELIVRFGYGALIPWVHSQEDGTLRAIGGPDQVVLRTPVKLQGEDKRTVAEFTVEKGDVVPFTLTYAPSHLAPPDPTDFAAALRATEEFSKEWSGRARIEPGERRDAVTGGIVAAPTTSLPETLGGIRNWDYCFCWLRNRSDAWALQEAMLSHLETVSGWPTPWCCWEGQTRAEVCSSGC